MIHNTGLQCALLEGVESVACLAFTPSREIQETTMQLAIGRFSIFDNPDVKKYLDRHGGTFLDLILRAVKRYVSL